MDRHAQVIRLLSDLKRAARNPVVDALSDELAVLMRQAAFPVLDQLEPRIEWQGDRMLVL